ncbi:MAG TPA: ABC transporter permease, partial [Thermoanaerobaculia bacterium]|nr:ABC transporter permease [Thermoanaerobaculia bacterium]
MGLMSLAETTFQDAGYAARRLARSPGATAAAVLTLALGIGANTAIFSVVQSVLLRSLPFRDPDRLTMIWLADAEHGFPRDVFSYPRFLDTRAHSASLRDAAAFSRATFALSGVDEPEQLSGVAASANLFSLLGAKARVGRTFLPGEDVPGRDHVVVLAHGLWVRRFGADPRIAGRRLLLNGQPYEVIGVMPAGFAFPERRQEIWVPLAPVGEDRDSRGSLWLDVVGRLRPGVRPAQADAELAALGRRLGEQYPATDRRSGVVLVPLRDQLTEKVRGGLLLLSAAVLCVLLVACANVAGMQLARAAARHREIAARLALGAGPGRLLRQLLTENLVLFALGGALGLLVAVWGVQGLVRIAPAELEQMQGVQVNWSAAAFALATCVLTGLLFGLSPAAQALGGQPADALRLRGPGGPAARSFPRHGAGTRRYLVVAQMALAVALLTGSGLLVRSFLRVQQMDLGFKPDHLLAATLVLPPSKYGDGPKIEQFYHQLAARLAVDPRVRSVGAVEHLLLGSLPNAAGSFTIEGQAAGPQVVQQPITWDSVLPGYFRTIGEPLVAGRDFSPADGPGAPPVAIINAGLAKLYWPGQDPIGKRFCYGSPQPGATSWLTIVGVAAEARRSEPGAADWLQSYVPLAQRPRSRQTLLLRTQGDPLALAGTVRQAVRSLDPAQPISTLTTVERLLADRLAPRRFNMLLLACFSTLALLMAAIGLYGVMSYLVTLRAQEIGLRMAIGARRADVLRLIAGHAATLACLGGGAGILASLAVTRWMSSLLYGIGSLDPLSFALAPLALAAAVSAAALFPTWRALRVDPISVLRQE